MSTANSAEATVVTKAVDVEPGIEERAFSLIEWMSHRGIFIFTAALVLVAYLVYRYWDQIKAAVSAAIDWIIDFVKDHWDIIKWFLGPMGLIIDAVIDNWDTLKKVFKRSIEWIVRVCKRIWGGITKWIIDPIKRAWDYLFESELVGWVRMRMKSGVWIGGVFGGVDGRPSYTAGYPEQQDLFLTAMIDVDPETGEFPVDEDGDIVHRPGGVLVRWEEIEYLQFVEPEGTQYGKFRRTASPSSSRARSSVASAAACSVRERYR